jgi:AcrR family transcriptional regulator
VAREAGVSPAAPYHHFKDKSELLDAVAEEGWHELGDAIGKGLASAVDPKLALHEVGVSYVTFARRNPALYRLMYHAACNREMMPDKAKGEDSGYAHVRDALIAAGADPNDERELHLAHIAAWCNVHGIAEMVGFKEFEGLKEEMGGEEAFVRGILRHTSIFARRARIAAE